MADRDSRAGARYATPEILAWVDELHTPHDEGLRAAFEAPDREGMPAIQVGVSEGRALGLFLRMVGARRVVEVGTLAGYSAIHMARELPEDGHLWTLESEEKHAAVARANVGRAGLAGRVTVLVGKALELLPVVEENGPFDAVFLDADKGNYDRYGRWAATHLRAGGLLLADNAYFFGDLLDPARPEAAAMRRFHEETCRAFASVCLPTPDGLVLGIRR